MQSCQSRLSRACVGLSPRFTPGRDPLYYGSCYHIASLFRQARPRTSTSPMSDSCAAPCPAAEALTSRSCAVRETHAAPAVCRYDSWRSNVLGMHCDTNKNLRTSVSGVRVSVPRWRQEKTEGLRTSATGLQSTRATTPRVVYPRIKRVLFHTFTL